MTKNILITGKPGCGKTTLIMEILKELGAGPPKFCTTKLRRAGGFYTSEIRERGIRKGFKIITLDGREGILAHVDIESPHRVSKYKVNIKDLEEIGVRSILDSLKENEIIVIDEVAKMEMFSKKFKEAVKTALDSKNKVLATIMLAPNPFCEKIKKRLDTKILYLTRENREKIKRETIKLLESK
ncbi:MAG: NTPase [Candidatus Paceibacterales bacterium]